MDMEAIGIAALLFALAWFAWRCALACVIVLLRIIAASLHAIAFLFRLPLRSAHVDHRGR